MNIIFQHTDSEMRGYKGISLDERECKEHFSGPVKNNLLDREDREARLVSLRALEADTGFKASEQLLTDIQALEDKKVSVQNFRIGEAYAEIVLENNFQCRFHWNELRDARNPKGNKTGADLVGFIEVKGQVLFLFGEVKTSSETARKPPQVMTNRDGIEHQLRDLYSNREKRSILIGYLQNKARLFPDGHQFKLDLNDGIRAYYTNEGNYQLIGVLVRDVAQDVQDVSVSYKKIRGQILEPTGLQLLALYLPIPKEDWLGIINEKQE